MKSKNNAIHHFAAESGQISMADILDDAGNFKFNSLSAKIHSNNCEVGWWDNPDQCVFEKLQLVSTEIAEATEGERKGLMDDHLPHRKMGEVELADAMIRLLDLGGRYEWTHDVNFVVDEVNNIFNDKVKSIAGRHLFLNITVGTLALAIMYEAGLDDEIEAYTMVLNSLVLVSKQEDYDIARAMCDKLEYNRTRADHKRENREKEGGKKF